MTVRIVTDSTSDIPSELAQELDITIVPVYVNMQGKSYRDRIEISPETVYQNMIENEIPITTSQPTPNDFAETYKNVLKEADEIVSIQCSTHISGLYQSALQGRDLAQGKGRIEVVDSTMTSIGLGVVAIVAARLAKSGASLSSVLDEARKTIAHMHIWGVFNTLKYALRGGRLSKITSKLGSMLSVKPMLTIKEGVLRPTGIVRTRAKGMEKIFENILKYKNIHDIGIVHSNAPEDAQKLRAKLSAIVDENRIYLAPLGPAVGVHGGPGALVVAINASETPMNAAEDAIEKSRLHMPHLPSFRSPKLNMAPSS
ncbi:MAG: DegV family protein [Dehalococcoidia bacterium]|nr:DegV family protein [Dehalococcoidia bacterium]